MIKRAKQLLSGLAMCTMAIAMGSSGVSHAQTPAKELFGAVTQPSNHRPAVIGGYSNGCLAGGVELAETGRTWQAMRLSRNRNWGHPVLIDYLQDLSRFAASMPGWDGIYIGDLAQPRGGPMLNLHVSHQNGIDADIWLRPGTNMNLSRAQREDLEFISMRRASGAYVNSNWTNQHHLLVRAAASDPRVARIFIFPGAKVQMCDAEPAGSDRSWLRKVRPIGGHHYHFHVRLHCPSGQRGCVPQTPPPPGDGCDEARQWQANILNPRPADPNAPRPAPRRELTMADLPAACSQVLSDR